MNKKFRKLSTLVMVGGVVSKQKRHPSFPSLQAKIANHLRAVQSTAVFPFYSQLSTRLSFSSVPLFLVCVDGGDDLVDH